MKYLSSFLLFGILGGGSLYISSSPLFITKVDKNFFQNPNLINRFEDTDFSYYSPIDRGSTGVRDYLFNNSFSLMWTKSTGDSVDAVGNAFLLNILYPKEMNDEEDESRLRYSPKYYSPGEKITFLMGTSFSFAKKLFDKVSDWKSEVNEKSETENLKLNSKTNSSSNKLFLSHPFPNRDKDVNNDNPYQDYLYSLKDETYYSSHDFLLKKPHYIKLENSDVEIVYAGVDLSVNKELIDMSLKNNNEINYQLENIHKKSNNSIDWKDTISSKITGETYKFATDFAVISVSVKINEIKRPFLDYIKTLFDRKAKIPKILKNELEIIDGKTSPIYTGGWSMLEEEEKELQKIKNLYVKAEPQKNGTSDGTNNKISNQKPSVINSSNFNSYLDLKFSKKVDNNSDNEYEYTDLQLYPNDTDGILFAKYKIKKKNGNIVYPQDFEVIYTGFKKDSSSSTASELMQNYSANKNKKDKRMKEFLEAEPTAIAEWKEAELKYSYFNVENIQQTMQKYIFQKPLEIFDTSTPLGIFKLGSSKYLNISHQLDIPNLNLKNSKGMIALLNNRQRNEDFMLGIYEGKNSWFNPFSLEEKSVGKIMMFMSPWRYDLFNEKNNLSKPSLGDSLKKKSLDKRLVYRNQIYISKGSGTT